MCECLVRVEPLNEYISYRSSLFTRKLKILRDSLDLL